MPSGYYHSPGVLSVYTIQEVSASSGCGNQSSVVISYGHDFDSDGFLDAQEISTSTEYCPSSGMDTSVTSLNITSIGTGYGGWQSFSIRRRGVRLYRNIPIWPRNRISISNFWRFRVRQRHSVQCRLRQGLPWIRCHRHRHIGGQHWRNHRHITDKPWRKLHD